MRDSQLRFRCLSLSRIVSEHLHATQNDERLKQASPPTDSASCKATQQAT